jgi:pilus assembly protein Flp/PilA
MGSIVEREGRLLRDESGATAVEYGIMIAAIAAVIVLMVLWVGGRTNNTFSTVNSALSSIGT